VRMRSAAELAAIPLTCGNGETVPDLTEVLHLVDGQVPLLIEVKDQDGGLGPDVGRLEAAAATALSAYSGPVAVMSFNPHSVAEMARLAPHLPRGLVTDAFDPAEWPVRGARCDELREIPDFDRVSAVFVSHNRRDLDRPRVAQLKASGVPVLCWTVRSPAEEATARRVADNVTFEGYTARHPS